MRNFKRGHIRFFLSTMTEVELDRDELVHLSSAAVFRKRPNRAVVKNNSFPFHLLSFSRFPTYLAPQ